MSVDLLADEPPDGTPDERWFSNNEVEPRSLTDWLSKARAVYALGDKLAGFER